MVGETYSLDAAVASNTISNGEFTSYRNIQVHLSVQFKVHKIKNICYSFSYKFGFVFISLYIFTCLVLTNTVTCFQDGIEVQKSSVKCEIKTGCKLIQKTGECCPDYQCGE